MATEPSSSTKPKKKWFWRFVRRSLLLLIVVCAIGAWFLPQIIANTAIKKMLLNKVLADSPGSIQIETVELGWNQKVVAKGIRILDAEQNVILTAEEMTTDKSLWSLIRSPSELGTIVLTRPNGTLIVRADGTNIGDALASKTTKKQQPMRWDDLPSVKLTVVEGGLSVHDMISDEKYQVSQFGLSFQKTASSKDPMQCVVSLKVDRLTDQKGEGQADKASAESGKLMVDISALPTANGEIKGKAKISADQIPIALLQPTLQLVIPDWSIVAVASMQSDLDWKRTGEGAIQVSGETSIDAKGVTVQNKEQLGPYRILAESFQGKLVFSTTETMDQSEFDLVLNLKHPVVQEIQEAKTVKGVRLVTVWEDPAVQFSGNGNYSSTDDSLQIKQVILNSKTLSAKVAGSVRELQSTCQTELGGTLQANSDWVDSSLRAYVDKEKVSLAGLQLNQFYFQGPLLGEHSALTRFSPPAKKTGEIVPASHSATTSEDGVVPPVTAQALFGWKKLEAYGLEMVPGSIVVQVKEDVLKIVPRNVSVGGGRLLLTPQIDLKKVPLQLSFPAGPALEKVAINDKLSRQWLQFVAPFLADATAVDGRFSLDIKKANIPLEDYAKMETEGTITFHNARIGPGPRFQRVTGIAGTVRQFTGKGGLAAALNQNARWIEMKEQAVDFKVTNGRVYHENLTFNIQGASVTTSGSVGMTDQTIDMVARMAVPKKWAKDRPFLKAMQGDGGGVDIRITGTLQEPKIESNAMDGLRKNFGIGTGNGTGNVKEKAAEAATGLIFDLINRRRKKKNR